MADSQDEPTGKRKRRRNPSARIPCMALPTRREAPGRSNQGQRLERPDHASAAARPVT